MEDRPLGAMDLDGSPPVRADTTANINIPASLSSAEGLEGGSSAGLIALPVDFPSTGVAQIDDTSTDVLLGNVNYSKEIDLWALGCIHVELRNAAILFPSKDIIPNNTLTMLTRMEKVLGQRLSHKYMDTFHVCIQHPSVFTTLNVYPYHNRPSNIPIDDICSEDESILLGMLCMDPEARKTIYDVDAMYRQSLREKYGYDDAPSHKLSWSPICSPFKIWESPERALQHNIAISDLCMAVHAKGFHRWTLHYAVFLFDSTLHVYHALFTNIKVLTYASLYVASLTEEEDDVSLSYFAKGAECADY